jgi:hypothetical protein
VKLLVVLALLLVSGEARADDDWDVRIPDEASAAVGAPAALSLTVAPAAGHTVSRDGPLRIYLEAGDGLELPRHRYRREQAADAAAEAPRFDLKYRATAAGDHVLTVEVRAWVCGRKTCKPVHTRRTVTIHAAAPAATPPPAQSAT